MTYSKFLFYAINILCIVFTLYSIFGKNKDDKCKAFWLGQRYFLAQSIIFVVLHS